MGDNKSHSPLRKIVLYNLDQKQFDTYVDLIDELAKQKSALSQKPAQGPTEEKGNDPGYLVSEEEKGDENFNVEFASQKSSQRLQLNNNLPYLGHPQHQSQ